MPKKPARHNPIKRNARTVQSAASVLQRISVRSGVVATTIGADSVAIERLCGELPADLRAHVVGSVEKTDELVLLVESAAWAGRLKLALADLPPRADPRRLTVRVMPRATTTRMDRYDSSHHRHGDLTNGATDPLADAGRPAPGDTARGRRRG
jgi:hypothetical protein